MKFLQNLGVHVFHLATFSVGKQRPDIDPTKKPVLFQGKSPNTAPDFLDLLILWLWWFHIMCFDVAICGLGPPIRFMFSMWQCPNRNTWRSKSEAWRRVDNMCWHLMFSTENRNGRHDIFDASALVPLPPAWECRTCWRALWSFPHPESCLGSGKEVTVGSSVRVARDARKRDSKENWRPHQWKKLDCIYHLKSYQIGSYNKSTITMWIYQDNKENSL